MVSGRHTKVDMKDENIIKQIEIFGKLIATHEEMAGHFDVTVRTIENYMSDKEGVFFRVYKKGESGSKQSLRRVQMKKAIEDEDNTLLIWLGKTVLKQKEPPREDTTVSSITFNIKDD